MSQKQASPDGPEAPPHPPAANNELATLSVRTSARVLRKKEERKDSESEPASEGACPTTTSGDRGSEGPDYGHDDPGGVGFQAAASSSSSAGDVFPAAAAAAAAAAACGASSSLSAQHSSSPSEKPRRTWELWSAKDKALFFEALNDSGKNFGAIESHFRAKVSGGKRAAAGVSFKNKDQIRTFYYRTWHKISKYIEFPENVKKSAREIYSLINYGEMRKRAGGALTMDERHGARLSELVFHGSTALRVRGKNIRVRTPICRALKKLNAKAEVSRVANGGTKPASTSTDSVPPSPNITLPGDRRKVRVPLAVVLQLKPRSMSDFVQVHAKCLQNPSIEVKVRLQQKLGAIIEYFEKRWLRSAKGSMQKSSPSIEQIESQQSEISQLELRFMVEPGVVLQTPVFTSLEPVTHVSLSLSSLQEKIEKRQQERKEQEMKLPTVQPELLQDDATFMTETVTSSVANAEVKLDLPEEMDDEKASLRENKTEDDDDSNNKKVLQTSWNKETAGHMTVGELYFMLGGNEDNTVNLTYSWKNATTTDDDNKEAVAANCSTSSPLTRLIQLASSEVAKKQQLKHLLGSPSTSSRSVSGNVNGVSSNLQRSPLQTTNGFSSPKANAVSSSTKNEPHSPLAVPLETSPLRATVSEANNAGSNGTSNGISSSTEFRRPNPVPPIRPNPGGITNGPAQAQAFRQQLDQLLPKFCHRRGRPALSRKTNIANRPIQSRPTIHSKDGKVKLRLLMPGAGLQSQPKMQQALQQRHNPTLPPIQLSQQLSLQQQQQQQPQQAASSLVPVVMTATPVVTVTNVDASSIPQISIPESSTPVKDQQQPPLSPTESLSSLFDPESYGVVGSSKSAEAPSTPTKGDHFLDSVLENSNSASSLLQTPVRHRPTPPTSPSRAISDSYLPELSLSSFLSFGESPAKSSGGGAGAAGHVCNANGVSSSSNGGAVASASTSSAAAVVASLNEDSMQSNSSEVDRQIFSMMNESSVDFSAKFAKLASHVLE